MEELVSKFCMSYSCGKDSTLALYKMIKAGHTPVAIIVSVSKKDERSWFHGVPMDMLSKVAQSMNIPLVCAESNGDEYAQVFKQALLQCKEMGAEVCAFGDIDIEEHRKWCVDICNDVGLVAQHPLWQGSRVDITNEFIDLGFKGVIKAVSKSFQLSQEYLGKTLTREIVKEFEEIGIDPCGENGEYHTFVYDGELFSFPIEFQVEGVYESEYAYSLVVK